jgi:hypothetical protein
MILAFFFGVALGDEKSPEAHKTFTFYLENDLFNGTDRQYTNGAKLTWISPDMQVYRTDPRIPEWGYPIIERLPFINEPGFQRNVALSIGQNMYTPENTQEGSLIKDDRPYAGIFYLAIGFYSKNQVRMDSFEFDVGVVGPHSYAEETQRIVHQAIGSATAKGWEHQLEDEPIFNLAYERKLKAAKIGMGEGFGFDFIPHGGGAVGNAYTGLNIGGQIRMGWNLPNDFGTSLIRPGSDTNAPIDASDPRFYPRFHRIGIHLFSSLDGRLVARNILLDGNTFRESHHVEKEPLVGTFALGVGIILHRMKISYAQVFQTREFEKQEDNQQYGAITVSFSY